MEIEQSSANIFKYQFDIAINQSVNKVWAVMFDQINEWWMGDYRALGSDSVISLQPQPGGTLLESSGDGATLEWYRVQMCIPNKSLHLVGYLAPDWGGPTTSMLKLSLAEEGDTCVLTVSDALVGNVTEGSAKSAKNGWREMFQSGLKRFVEGIH
ncbi:MAG: SRPBCC domain-containing protein [Aestuariibacter sp.]